jgi:hypothetical protein
MVKRLENNLDEMYDLSITNFRKGAYTLREKVKKIAKPVKRGLLPAFLAGVMGFVGCKFPGPDPNPTPNPPNPPDPQSTYVTISGTLQDDEQHKIPTQLGLGYKGAVKAYLPTDSSYKSPIRDINGYSVFFTDSNGNFSFQVDKNSDLAGLVLRAEIFDANGFATTYVRTIDGLPKGDITSSTDSRMNPAIRVVPNPDFCSPADFRNFATTTNGTQLRGFDTDNLVGIEIMKNNPINGPGIGSFTNNDTDHNSDETPTGIKNRILRNNIAAWFGGTSNGNSFQVKNKNGTLREVYIQVDTDDSSNTNYNYYNAPGSDSPDPIIHYNLPNGSHWITIWPDDTLPPGTLGETDPAGSAAYIRLRSNLRAIDDTGKVYYCDDYVIDHEFGHASGASGESSSDSVTVYPQTVMEIGKNFSFPPNPVILGATDSSGNVIGIANLKEAKILNEETYKRYIVNVNLQGESYYNILGDSANF